MCLDTDTRRHQVEFVLVPFCRISLFYLYFVRTARGILALSITKRCKSLSLSLSQSSAVVQPLREGQTAGAELFGLSSAHAHTHTHTCCHTRCCHTTYQHTMCMHMHELCLVFHPVINEYKYINMPHTHTHIYLTAHASIDPK